MTFSAMAFIGIAAAAVWAALFAPPSADERALEARLLSLPARPVPVAILLPEKEWDRLCRLDPYSFPSRFLPRYLGESLKGYRYEPSDVWIDEEWNGLAFIDHSSRTIHVRAIPYKTINRLAGQRCVDRTEGKAALVEIRTPTVSYRQIELSQ